MNNDCWILIVDDDQGMRETLHAIFKTKCNTIVADSAEAAMQQLEDKPFDVVLTDVRLPGMDGLELLGIIKERWPSTEVIVVSVISEVAVAVEAMRLGAFIYVEKDFDWDPMLKLVELALHGRDPSREWQRLKKENMTLRRQLSSAQSKDRVVSNIEDRRRRETD